MRCPSCDKALTCETFHGQTIDRCPLCDGIWLDESELGPVVPQFAPPDSPSATPKPCSDGLTCPKCNGSMAPFNYAHDSGVFINKCASCGGIWLQSGQLELLAQYRAGTPAIQSLGNAFADEIRRSNRWQFARRVLRSRLLSGIVAIVYLVVALLATANLESVLRLTAFLLLPMTCIWFPDAMGSLKGIRLGLVRPMITQSTPGDFVALGGWILLLCPVVVALIAWA